jgi:hypothetical protein
MDCTIAKPPFQQPREVEVIKSRREKRKRLNPELRENEPNRAPPQIQDPEI